MGGVRGGLSLLFHFFLRYFVLERHAMHDSMPPNPDGFRPPYMLPDDIPYERWVKHIFDHSVSTTGGHWYDREFDPSSTYEEWAGTTERAVEYMSRLFRNATPSAGQYTRGQIDQGIQHPLLDYIQEYLVAAEAFGIPAAPWPMREETIDAMFNFYRDFLALVYGDDLGHTDAHSRPIAGLYMWWDRVTPGGADERRMRGAILRMFERVLNEVKAEACLESVLHGLSHWYIYFPEEVPRIVDQFLANNNKVSDSLREYAKLARWGGAM